MCSTLEKPAADQQPAPPGRNARANHWNPASRPRKEVVLPEIRQLALDGHSAETIGRMLGISGRTVRHWLQKLRQEWLAAAAVDAAEMAAVTLARLEAIYREAMQEWRSSCDVEARGGEEPQAADDRCDAKTKRPARSQPRRPNTALLTRATAAAKAMFDLKLRAAASLERTAGSAEQGAGSKKQGAGAVPAQRVAEQGSAQPKAEYAPPPREIVAAPCPPPAVAPVGPPALSDSQRREEAIGQLVWGPLMDEDLCEMSEEEVQAVHTHCSAARKKYITEPTWALMSDDLLLFRKRELLHWIPLWAARRRAAGKPSPTGNLLERDLKHLSDDEIRRVAACHVSACWAEERKVIFGPVSQPSSPVAIVNAESSPVSSETPPVTEPLPSAADDRPTQPPCNEEGKASPPCEVENDRQPCAATEFRQVSATNPPEECSGSNAPMTPGTPAAHCALEPIRKPD